MFGTKKKEEVYAENRWNFYEAVIENAHLEWPGTVSESEEEAKKNCMEWLDLAFQGEYEMKEFHLKYRNGI